jgi:UDP-N-acetylglucosamine--N-acetylmuramyl-(pentapeptide) pyrophosphoryl-undecaprenol N-acetylglucosamine transferase
MKRAPVLIMAGGTGGHVFPALAVARALHHRQESVVWLGSQQGMETRIVPREGIPLETIRVAGLRRKGALAWLAAPWHLVVALIDAVRVLRRRRPGVVLGMGGFASGPGGVAAWLLGTPLVIHEQNAVAGLTNRLLAGLAREVLEAFPGSFSTGRNAQLTGNPVRADICALAPPGERFAGRSGPLRLLVIGGSQGARVLNEHVAGAVALLPPELRPEIWHQAGETTIDVARAAYATAGVEARIDPFIGDMAAAYGWADMVVCRAGALTVAEIAAAGLPAVFVPFAGAVDDHQTRNAAFLVTAGAATLVPQSDLSAARLAAELAPLMSNRTVVLERATRARERSRPDATEKIADICQRLALAGGS